MNEKKWEQVNISDVRVGDHVRLFLGDYSVNMPIVHSITNGNVLRGGPCSFSIAVSNGATIYRRRLPKPKLPTKPGSAIIVTKAYGQTGRWLMIRKHVGGPVAWCAPIDGPNGMMWHSDHDIEEWSLAKVVEA